jgi:hypothetical protein
LTPRDVLPPSWFPSFGKEALDKITAEEGQGPIRTYIYKVRTSKEINMSAYPDKGNSHSRRSAVDPPGVPLGPGYRGTQGDGSEQEFVSPDTPLELGASADSPTSGKIILEVR